MSVQRSGTAAHCELSDWLQRRLDRHVHPRSPQREPRGRVLGRVLLLPRYALLRPSHPHTTRSPPSPGVALGRIFLPPLNMLMGERRSVIIYLALAIALECVAWFVPILASTAVCTALVGVAISTFYTAAITMGGRLVPRNMHADAFALMSSVGQSGSAFWPLIVGVISTKKGIWVVEPTVVALLGAQGVCWLMVPRVGRRSE